MVGLDTNVLLRYLVQDDPVQAAVVEREIEATIRHKTQLLIHPLVLCEMVWVLDAAYGYAKEDIVDALEQILHTAQFEFVEKDVVWRAFSDYRSGKGDFADYSIGRGNQTAGAERTLTFDKALKGSALFEVMSAK